MTFTYRFLRSRYGLFANIPSGSTSIMFDDKSLRNRRTFKLNFLRIQVIGGCVTCVPAYGKNGRVLCNRAQETSKTDTKDTQTLEQYMMYTMYMMRILRYTSGKVEHRHIPYISTYLLVLNSQIYKVEGKSKKHTSLNQVSVTFKWAFFHLQILEGSHCGKHSFRQYSYSV